MLIIDSKDCENIDKSLKQYKKKFKKIAYNICKPECCGKIKDIIAKKKYDS